MNRYDKHKAAYNAANSEWLQGCLEITRNNDKLVQAVMDWQDEEIKKATKTVVFFFKVKDSVRVTEILREASRKLEVIRKEKLVAEATLHEVAKRQKEEADRLFAGKWYDEDFGTQEQYQAPVATENESPELKVINTYLKKFGMGVLRNGATSKEIRQAQMGLVKKLHPDVGGRTEDMQAVNAACDLLRK